MIKKIKDIHLYSTQYFLLQKSNLFNKSYYLRSNKDVRIKKVNPYFHFLIHGWKEGRNPSELFNIKSYLEANPDVKKNNINPLIHYLLHGKKEGRTFKPIEKNKIGLTYRNKKIKDSRITILFIGHDAHLAGAQMVLLKLITWYSKYLNYNIKILLLDGGRLLPKYKELGETYLLSEISKDTIKLLTNKTDIIFLNTIVACNYLESLNINKKNIVCYIHELEKSIRLYGNSNVIEIIRQKVDYIICGSKEIKSNFLNIHKFPEERLKYIPPFIDQSAIENINITNPSTTNFKVVGCGTGYWRKGLDLFIKTAINVNRISKEKVQFIWVGKIVWDNFLEDFPELPKWNELHNLIVENQLINQINFVGEQENFKPYIEESDLFFLPSREDPFPLVALEAMQLKKPIICFSETGGIPEVVHNIAGISIDQFNVLEASKTIISLLNKPNKRKELGEAGYNIVKKNYLSDIQCFNIFSAVIKKFKISPTISIIVPVYNSIEFLEERLNSIFSQTFRDYELILLDDNSLDGSKEKLKEIYNTYDSKLVFNKINSGSPFHQWNKGIKISSGEYIWIAEADDIADMEFLRNLYEKCRGNSKIGIAYSNSYTINRYSDIIGDYTEYYQAFGNHWASNYVNSYNDELNWGLGIKNTIPNVSATLINRKIIRYDYYKKLANYKFCGDWMFYLYNLKGFDIAFISKKLNYHRKHKNTVTSRFNSEKKNEYFSEIKAMHEFVVTKNKLNKSFYKKIMAFYKNELIPFFGETEYIKKLKKEETKQNIIAIITTNDHSFNGGSEKLWKNISIKLATEGFKIYAAFKKEIADKAFVEKLKANKITIVNKSKSNYLNDFISLDIDLFIISIGDQNAGTEIFEFCTINQIPYVIINQLVKHPDYDPVNEIKIENIKSGYTNAKLIYFTSTNNKELMERRIKAKLINTSQFYNPFDVSLNYYAPFPKLETINLAILGNLNGIHKGQHLLLDVIKNEKWQKRKIKFNFYGSGQDAEFFRRYCELFNINNAIFHGYVSDKEEIWKINHGIVMPSLMEGMPLALIGAIISRRIPIVTNVGGNSEVILHNKTGYIIEKPTNQEIDNILEHAYNNKTKWEEMAIKGRNHLLQILPNDPETNFLEKIYTVLETL